MKKAFAILLAGGLLLMSMGGVAEGATFANPGTYSATAQGRNGDVTVTATFSEGEITDIQVEHAETPSIGDVAIEELTSLVLENQSLAVDAVSGATLASDAFKQALEDCVKQAGGDVEALKEKAVAPTQVNYDVTEADIIIVGAGGAGLTAAKAASDKGASVIILEKSGVIGGNSPCSQMGINAADSKVQEGLGMEFATAELLKEAQMQWGGRENLVDAYVENSGKAVDWFADELGIEFSGRTGDRVDPNDPLASVGEDHPSGGELFMVRADADGFTSNTIINTLSKSIDGENVVLYVNTEAKELVTDENGAVTGVKAVAADGSELTFTGKAVLLATGGFGQNHEMVVKYRPDFHRRRHRHGRGHRRQDRGHGRDADLPACAGGRYLAFSHGHARRLHDHRAFCQPRCPALHHRGLRQLHSWHAGSGTRLRHLLRGRHERRSEATGGPRPGEERRDR